MRKRAEAADSTSNQVFCLGSTDGLSPELSQWALIILTAYFGGRSIEKVARILSRK